MQVMRIVVPVDGDADLEVVDHAIALAREHHARLELVGGIPRLWLTSAYALDAARLEAELREYACQLLRDAVDRVDGDVCVTLRQVRGRAADHLLRQSSVDGELLVMRSGRRRLSLWPRRRRCTSQLLRVPVGNAAAAAA